MNRTCSTCENEEKKFSDEYPCAKCRYCDLWEMKHELYMNDPVNHPTHYTSGCGFECIEMMEMVFGKEAVHDFCTLNAFKYLWRYRQKGGADDIGKAKWYLEYTKGLNVFKNRQAIDKMREHISKEEANE